MIRFLFMGLILFSFHKSFSQLDFGSEGTFSNKWHEGTLILKNQDTLVGLVKFDDVSDDFTGFSLSKKVKFRSVENPDEKQKFKKDDIDHFEVINNSGEKVKYVYLKLKVKGYTLLKVIAEGKVNLYIEDYFYTQTHNQFANQQTTMTYSGQNLYAQKVNENKVEYLFMANTTKSFKKKAVKYFKDCPELVTKLEDGELKRKDYLEIVDMYNSCSG